MTEFELERYERCPHCKKMVIVKITMWEPDLNTELVKDE